MNQNSVSIENMADKSTDMLANSAQPGSLSPEVSNLITSVHVLVNMLKMQRVSPKDSGWR